MSDVRGWKLREKRAADGRLFLCGAERWGVETLFARVV